MIAIAKVERYGLRAPRGGCTVAGKRYRGGCFCLPYNADDPHGLGLAAPAAVAEVGTLALGDYRVKPRILAIEVGAPAAPIALSICGFRYQVEPVPIAPSVGTAAFRLDRLDTNSSYHVHKAVDGSLRCT